MRRAARALTVTLGASLALAACATYSPLPLPTGAQLATSLAPQGVAPLGMNAVATLAVLNNPELRAARAATHVGQAQAFAAGLLPDPQFNYTGDYKMDGNIPPTDPRYPEYDAYGLGLYVDVQALLTHSSNKASAGASYEQARLDLLWQEWQTVAEARTLFVEQSIATERDAFLAPAVRVYAEQLERSQRALAAGNVTREQTSADLAVLVDARTQLGAADRSLLQAEQGLRALLGVAPQVALPLRPLGPPSVPDRAAMAAAAARLAESRPDLRALAAGYHAQEEKLRAAVLSQFPNFQIGITRARDDADVHTTGFGATLTLPIFDRGRGNIAIQRATREQLRAEYLARLDQGVANVWQLWGESEELAVQLADLDRRLPRLKENVDAAKGAYERGNFPVASYLALVSAYLAAEGAHFDLLQNLWSDSIALATVLGTQVEPQGAPRAP
jgi:outer membrane protein TolC